MSQIPYVLSAIDGLMEGKLAIPQICPHIVA